MTETQNREAAFLARITASTTHEIRNVLAIVKESAGLVEDLVRSFSKRGTLKEDRVFAAVSRIDAQVSRGAELLTNLNRLAHGLDHPSESINLAAATHQVAYLSERMARQGRHTVQARPPTSPLSVTANALHLQMALFAAVECALEVLGEGGMVWMQPGRWTDRPAVEVIGEIDGSVASGDVAGAAAWPRLTDLLETLGASVEVAEASCSMRVVLPAARTES